MNIINNKFRIIIKPKSTERLGHFRESKPNSQTCEKAVQQPKEKSKPSRTTTAQLHNTQIESEEMPSCDDCGLVFEDMHDLQRHVKKWCPKNGSPKRNRDDEEMEENQPPKNGFHLNHKKRKRKRKARNTTSLITS